MNFFREYWPHITTGIAGSGGLLAIIFRDGIKDIIGDWRKERDARRAERLAAAGKGDAIGTQLIAVFRDDLKDRREHDIRVVQVLEAVKEILTRLEGKADGTGKQLDLVHQRVISIQGAVGRVQ